MEYFLFAMSVSIVLLGFVGLLVFHVVTARDWREERAYLLNAAVSQNAREFAQRVNPVPAEGPAVPAATKFWEQVEGYEAPVGM
jgi:hypothetical protein